MAYENVNVGSLRASLLKCKSALDYKKSNEIIGILSVGNSTVWKSNAEKNLQTALSKLTKTRYKDLKNKLDKYLKIVDYIESYQKLDKKNKSLITEYNSLSSSLYKIEKGKRVIDDEVDSKMSSKKSSISSNKAALERLDNKIKSSI